MIQKKNLQEYAIWYVHGAVQDIAIYVYDVVRNATMSGHSGVCDTTIYVFYIVTTIACNPARFFLLWLMRFFKTITWFIEWSVWVDYVQALFVCWLWELGAGRVEGGTVWV